MPALADHLADAQQRADRRVRAINRIERYGCCGETPSCIEVHDFDESDDLVRVWFAHRCPVTLHTCSGAALRNVYARWSVVNRPQKEVEDVDRIG